MEVTLLRKESLKRGKYEYMSEEQAKMEKYTAENGPAQAL